MPTPFSNAMHGGFTGSEHYVSSAQNGVGLGAILDKINTDCGVMGHAWLPLSKTLSCLDRNMQLRWCRGCRTAGRQCLFRLLLRGYANCRTTPHPTDVRDAKEKTSPFIVAHI